MTASPWYISVARIRGLMCALPPPAVAAAAAAAVRAARALRSRNWSNDVELVTRGPLLRKPNESLVHRFLGRRTGSAIGR